MYYGLLYAGMDLSKEQIGVIGLGIYTGAYISEVVRTGISSIPHGQTEAALSQGFTHLQAMRYIILPQSVKIALPPLVNQMVALIKNTSVLAMIAGGDLMYRSNAWASNGTLSYGPAYLTCGILFFCLCFPLTYFVLEYGLTYSAAFPGCASETEPSAATVAKLMTDIMKEQIPLVCYIELSNHQIADILAEQTGAKTALFYTCHNVSADDFAAGKTYLELMRMNVDTLREALN